VGSIVAILRDGIGEVETHAVGTNNDGMQSNQPPAGRAQYQHPVATSVPAHIPP
jgi:hypothetical protein